MSAVVDTVMIEFLANPRDRLSASERTLLRKLYRDGPAISAGFKHGWMLGGTRYSDKAINRFFTLKLARCWRDADGVKLGLNDLGALAAWKITPSEPSRSPPDDD